MKTLRSALGIGLSLLALLAACAPMYDHSPAASREVAGLDDVTNGLAMEGDSTARFARPFGFTSSGAAKFADTNDDGIPDQRLPDVSEPPAGRMMIYRGAMTIEVSRPETAMATFLQQVQSWGGYLSAQQDRQLTVRVPAAQFEPAMAALRELGRVLSESRQADDVTKQYFDLGIRLENARKARERLLELLEKATKVEDMLAIEKELRRVSEEIEQMEGEQKFLADQVAMATVQAGFEPVAQASRQRLQQASRFDWINRVGVRAAREQF